MLLGCIFCAAGMRAATSEELTSLENEMLRLINGNDREAFTRAAENLKTASLEEGDERMFYKAWGYQAIYEATNQNQQKANDICEEITKYARQEGSIYGEYMAMHTEALILLQTQDFDAQENAFIRALEFHHRHFPNEGAIEDLRELFRIAYDRGNFAKAHDIAYQVLAEPNVSPRYKFRILARLSHFVFRKNDVEEFNRLYSEMNRLSKMDDAITFHPYVKVNYLILNRDYEQALILADSLSADTCAERKAIIYERLGDYEKAYNYLTRYKEISDSIERASYNQELRDMLLRMSNNRQRMEKDLLEKENISLRYRFYAIVAIFIIMIMLFIAYLRYKFIRKLKQDNEMLRYGKEDAETTLIKLNELSLYENLMELPLNMPVSINKLCNQLATNTQKHCHIGATTIFQTEFPDDFKLLTNPEALENLLMYLLTNTSRFIKEGIIWMKCSDTEKCIRFSITGTRREHDNQTDADIYDRTIQDPFASLNICQSISSLLHGRVWYDEEYSDGIRYIFEIQKSITDILMQNRQSYDADY